MHRRLPWLLLLLVLCSCTLAPDATPAPVTPCPTCQPCPVCPTPAPTQVLPTLVPPTPIPSETPTSLPPTETSVPTLVVSGEPHSGSTGDEQFTLAVQPTTPRLTQNYVHPDQGCAWLGVAGQIFDEQDLPISNLVLVITGDLNGAPVDAVGLTGSAPAYGPGGYEIVLGQQPVASAGALYIQVFDLTGLPVSFPVALDTSADCDKNLVLVNFVRIP